MSKAINEKVVEVGLIRGRHEMPVSDFIFSEDIKDVFDFASMDAIIKGWAKSNLTFSSIYGTGIDQVDFSDVELVRSNERVNLYVTGLTQVTAEVIKLFLSNGIKLTLMHYDRDTNSYRPQVML